MSNPTLTCILRYWRRESRSKPHRDCFLAYGNSNRTTA